MTEAQLTVRILLEDRLDEILGAVNYWVDAGGKAYNVGAGHVDWAAKHLGIKLSNNSLGRDYWEIQGRVYQKMYQRGWMRAAVIHNKHENVREMMVDFKNQTKEQMRWVEQKAIEDGLRVVDDQGNLLGDWSAPSEEDPEAGNFTL